MHEDEIITFKKKFGTGQFSFLCLEQRDHGNLITTNIFLCIRLAFQKNSKFCSDTIIYTYEYSYLFFMNNSKTHCSQSKKKLQTNENLLKIRSLYNFDFIYHRFLLSIQMRSVIKSLNEK